MCLLTACLPDPDGGQPVEPDAQHFNNTSVGIDGGSNTATPQNAQTSSGNSSTNNGSTGPNIATSPNNSTTANNPNLNNTSAAGCPNSAPRFFGQIGNGGPHDGGAPNPGGVQSVDAGLGAASPGDASLQVADALVIATSFDANANRDFWVADASVALRVSLTTPAPFDIAVGQRISFNATSVDLVGTDVRISAIENVRITSQGNAVPVFDLGDAQPTSQQINRIGKVTGQLVTQAEPFNCDGARCFVLQYEEAGVQSSATFRTTSNFIELGDCITFVGPLKFTPSHLGPSPRTYQFDHINFAWAETRDPI